MPVTLLCAILLSGCVVFQGRAQVYASFMVDLWFHFGDHWLSKEHMGQRAI